ncbi:MAG: multiheme c-type cytochrome, partial [Armatimonadetes bacterium]|nr:multiheme c-type cytochrome [Armatimonadota bacterium]
MRGIWKRKERHSYTVPRRDSPALRVAAAALCACWFCAGAWAESIVNTKHNLSATGPGTVRAISEDEICIFRHTPHRARTTAPLWTRRDSTSPSSPYNSPTLKSQPGQPTGASKLCLSCHDGNVAAFNLQAVFRKTSIHPVSRSVGAHKPGESPLDAHGHVECVDCHNPHRAQRGSTLAPAVKDVMRGVTGIDASGGPLPEARYEYEVCFKCHADRAENPLNLIPRRIASLNVRREFSPSSPSFHPVEIAGVNRDVPSLISPLTESSLIYCTDC